MSEKCPGDDWGNRVSLQQRRFSFSDGSGDGGAAQSQNTAEDCAASHHRDEKLLTDRRAERGSDSY